MEQAGTDFSEMSLDNRALFRREIKMDGRSSAMKNLTKLHTSRGGRKLDPSWSDTSRRRQDVIRLLSGNSTSPIFRALICELICGWQRQAWACERILDIIRCLTPSSFVDLSLIGNEGAAFPLWGTQSWGWTWTERSSNSNGANFTPEGWRKKKKLPIEKL